MRRLFTAGFVHAALLTGCVAAIAFAAGGWSTFVQFDFLLWDSEHFEAIARSGYDPLRQAFFPGFPLLWKLSGLGPALISLAGWCVFVAAAAALAKALGWDRPAFLLFLAAPSVLFMMLPYPESWLFACLSWAAVSWRKGHAVWFGCAIALAALFKPTVAVLLPAFTGVWIWWSHGRPVVRRMCLAGLAAVVAGTLAAWGIQVLWTGDWLGFFRAQALWGNYLQWPHFPLSTWGGLHAVLMDAIALWVCLLAGISLIRMLQSPAAERSAHALTAWAAASLAFTGLFVLAFRGGSLFSLNRFVFASPFFWVWLAGMRHMPRRHWLAIAAAAWVAIAFAMGAWVHIRHVLKFAGLGAFLLLGLAGLQRAEKTVGAALYAVLLMIQAWIAWVLVRGGWLA